MSSNILNSFTAVFGAEQSRSCTLLSTKITDGLNMLVNRFVERALQQLAEGVSRGPS